MDLDSIRKIMFGNTSKIDNDESQVTNAQSIRYQSAITKLQNAEDELVELNETSFGTFDYTNATIEEIENEITAKQNEIEELQTSTDLYIQECQNKINDIIAQGTDIIPTEVQAKYISKSNDLQSEIQDKTGRMQEISSIISENNSKIEQAQSIIEDEQKRIEENNAKIERLKNSDSEADKKEIEKLQAENEEINSYISELNSVIAESNSIITASNKEYSSTQEENDALQSQFGSLMPTLMDEYYQTHTEEDRVYEDSFLASQIEGLEDCIEQAQVNLTNNMLNLSGEIDTLNSQIAIKQLEQAQAAGSVMGTSYGITGGTYTGDLPVNNELASIANSVASSMGSTGWCLKGVNNALEKAYGFRLSYNSAYQAIPALQSRSDFTEVTNQYPNAQSLTNLPAGAIVVWENSSNHPHGHISIALGNGQEASDHIQSQTVNYGTQYHVFVKTA